MHHGTTDINSWKAQACSGGFWTPHWSNTVAGAVVSGLEARLTEDQGGQGVERDLQDKADGIPPCSHPVCAIGQLNLGSSTVQSTPDLSLHIEEIPRDRMLRNVFSPLLDLKKILHYLRRLAAFLILIDSMPLLLYFLYASYPYE